MNFSQNHKKEAPDLHTHYRIIWISFILFVFLSACAKQHLNWQGQDPIQKVNTQTLPIQKQYLGTFILGHGIYCSNAFDGARLNGAVLTNDSLISVLITPENSPINHSPWYSFKIWSEEEQAITLKLTYSEGVNHRYYPKLSFDGLNWERLDPAMYFEDSSYVSNTEMDMPRSITMNLSIGPDTLWVSAQELITSKNVNNWIDKMASAPFITTTKIGESHEGRAINVLKIGKSDDQKMLIVMSRQHPPEVTGYLAMKYFVETLCGDTETATKFRSEYNTYVFPLVNPDGVDNGHWRHNSGGVDLNRDWEDFNQPETAAIKSYLQNKIASTGGKFYFGVDFHSTWEDIYYTIDPELKGNMPGLVYQLIDAVGREIPDYEPNIRPGVTDGALVTSSDYFFFQLGAESLTYEIGDNTPRDFLKRKAEISAMKIMELMTD